MKAKRQNPGCPERTILPGHRRARAYLIWFAQGSITPFVRSCFPVHVPTSCSTGSALSCSGRTCTLRQPWACGPLSPRPKARICCGSPQSEWLPNPRLPASWSAVTARARRYQDWRFPFHGPGEFFASLRYSLPLGVASPRRSILRLLQRDRLK
jgi:hypothetical protein